MADRRRSGCFSSGMNDTFRKFRETRHVAIELIKFKAAGILIQGFLAPGSLNQNYHGTKCFHYSNLKTGFFKNSAQMGKLRKW